MPDPKEDFPASLTHDGTQIIQGAFQAIHAYRPDSDALDSMVLTHRYALQIEVFIRASSEFHGCLAEQVCSAGVVAS